MFSFDIQKIAISSLGAVALSATCVLAAVGPAHAANAPFTTGDWQRSVAEKVSTFTDSVAGRIRPGVVAETMLALRFTAEGDYAGASVSRSSGDTMLERHAIAIADGITYPALPAGYRGQPQTIALRLVFGDEKTVVQRVGETGQVSVEMASAPRGGKQIAVK